MMIEFYCKRCNWFRREHCENLDDYLPHPGICQSCAELQSEKPSRLRAFLLFAIGCFFLALTFFCAMSVETFRGCAA